MILVDGEKYSCVQCIRGHRSSTCKHSKRPLVQVRGRGRPSLNSGHRIAVTESEIVKHKEEDAVVPEALPEATKIPNEKEKKNDTNNENKSCSSCCSSRQSQKVQRPVKAEPSPSDVFKKKSCCSSHSRTTQVPSSAKSSASCCACSSQKPSSTCADGTSIIMLRASKRQFVDIKRDGNVDYVGPYSDQSMNNFQIDVQPKRPRKRMHTRGASCVPSIQRHPKLVKTMKLSQFSYNIDPSVTAANSTELPHLHDYLQTYQPAAKSVGFNNALPLQVPHAVPQRSQQQAQLQIPTSQLSQPYQQYYGIQNPGTDSGNSWNTGPLVPEPKFFDMLLTEGCTAECNCGPTCNCPGCLIHRTNEELKEYGILAESSAASTPLSETRDSTTPQIDQDLNSKNENNVDFNLINLESIDEMLLQEMFEEECFCEPQNCRCYNCVLHGISDGVRLSDGVRVCDIASQEEDVDDKDEEDSNDTESKTPSSTSQEPRQYPSTEVTEYSIEPHDCGCAPEECECYNCEKHGIINGERLARDIEQLVS